MADILLGLSLACCLFIVYEMQQRIKKLKQKVDDNKELIKDLYRIDDERILKDS